MMMSWKSSTRQRLRFWQTAKIVLTLVEEGGRTSLSIDLHGHPASILSLATKAERPLNSGPEIGYMKLAAGHALAETDTR
jgi:hypothetical protein